ncbi:MAG: chloramphenicol phosphotransferase [Chloroflexota bacterium]
MQTSDKISSSRFGQTGFGQTGFGQIIILNGTPRSGKSSIAAAIQETFSGVWLNMGVDNFMAMTPKKYRPGIGLRPGGERPDLEEKIGRFYRAMYDSIAAHSRLGLNVVVDVGHHDVYSQPRGILPACARRLLGLPAIFVGVRCPLDVILARREQTGWHSGKPSEQLLRSVRLWQEAVHQPGVYDLEVDTSRHSPESSATVIGAYLKAGSPITAFQQLAAMAPDV